MFIVRDGVIGLRGLVELKEALIELQESRVFHSEKCILDYFSDEPEEQMP